MKWLENNPAGVVLVSICGLLALVFVALVFVWSRPASSGAAAASSQAEIAAEVEARVSELGPLSDYRVVTERPVFAESRRPVLVVDGEGLDIDDSMGSTVADAPQVTLKGVVITPDMQMVTLQPVSGGESVIAHAGVPLEGEYVGWTVSDIDPRRITLTSLDGETMDIELQVNSRKIEEPLKPDPAAEVAQAGSNSAKAVDDEDGEPLSRAEEIRQRIAERREELRRQAEMDDEGSSSGARSPPSDYQKAIRNMVNRKKDADEDNEKDNDGGNGG